MKIALDLKKLKSSKLSLEEFIIVLALTTNIRILHYYDPSPTAYENLHKLGLITFVRYDPLKIKTDNEQMLRCRALVEDTYEWVEDWRKLWPEGIKTGGNKYVNSSLTAVTLKLKKFFKSYDFTVEEIMEGTRRYLEAQEQKDWDRTQCSMYFIEKDGDSNLANYCEEVQKEKNRPLRASFSTDA